jgi:5,10-methylenetetrahydromethanopterin reductase
MPPNLPRFSLRLNQGLTPQACRALAASAEAHGFDSLWFAENPFGRAILPAVAACAADTSRVRLGLGILNPYQHHPTLIAQEAGVLDELSAGRVRLGIGSGIAQRIAQLGMRYRSLAALTDAVQIVRGLLRHETVTYRGAAFSANRVALEFAAPRPDMPIHLAAMGDRSLALCGRLADGLIVSNLCPLAYTARAVAIVRESAAAVGRESFDIVQYLPCATRPDGAEAREIAKEAVGTMLIALWPTGNDWPAQRETIVRLSGIARSEMVGALDRLRRGEPAGRVLDDRFISAFALAGTAEQVIAQAAQYHRAGAYELALSFAGPQPAADAAYFARAVKRLIPDGELAIDVRRSPPDSD